jgi:hypothetical protein
MTPDRYRSASAMPFGLDAEPLEGLIATFRRWLHLPDPGPLYVVLATVVANKMTGDPVWLLLVGPSSSGKTELLGGAMGLPDVFGAATLSEASLLSGTPRKEVSPEAKGGLLLQIGEFGVLVLKDFGSILSLNREESPRVLAALREIYDGSWTRYVGSDGGRRLHWSGKIGLLAGATPAIDGHHSVMSALGERFVMFRLVVDEEEQARRRLENTGSEERMRDELMDAVRTFFQRIEIPAGSTYSKEDRDHLTSLSTLIVRARSPVIRGGVGYEILLVPDAEGPGRLVGMLGKLLIALRAIGVEEDVAWRLVEKVGFDSMPSLRRRARASLQQRVAVDNGRHECARSSNDNNSSHTRRPRRSPSGQPLRTGRRESPHLEPLELGQTAHEFT